MNNRKIESEVLEKYMFFTHIPTGNLIAVEKTEDKIFNNLRLQYGNDLSIVPNNEVINGFLLILNKDTDNIYSLSKSNSNYKINELENIGVKWF